MPRVLHHHLPTPKKLVGTVVSASMDRTAVVAFERFKIHERTRKVMKHVTKLFAHDHHEICGVGDRVQVKAMPSRVSKKKVHTVIDILRRHPQLEGEPFPFSRLLRHPSEHAS
jgi:small subunit ribosomal protein S17